MESWHKVLKFDPLPKLFSSENKAIVFFVNRDLLYENGNSITILWELPSVLKILRRQKEDDSWKYFGGKPYIRSSQNYDQIETYRMLDELIEKYGLNKSHPAIQSAAEFLFSFQTDEGDFRGIYGNHYTPNYSAGIMELLIKAGFGNDLRIKKGFDWLLSIRQHDGGWAIPTRTRGMTLDVMLTEKKPITPDVSKPFSHLVTGVVLRAFAAHEAYRKSGEALAAGRLLASRFFKKDTYPDRNTVEFWTKFSYPFLFTDLCPPLTLYHY